MRFHIPLKRLLIFIFVGVSLLRADPSLFDPDSTITIDEIDVGDKGVWQTVVSGQELSTFPLKVLGVVRNFAGPKRDVIICEALDDKNKESGPVAGMSGSPVYINGKLAGAYAYGFLWPKKQAIIGVTPIHQMLEVLEKFPKNKENISNSQSAKSLSSSSSSLSIIKGNKNELQEIINKQPLFTTSSSNITLQSGGISKETLKLMADHLADNNVTIIPQSSSSSASKEENFSTTYPMEPGYPVAGVLMDGDFNFTGVGTITWKEGNTLLGFGHPYFQSGAVDIPMAGAEIITVVQSVSKSFKLSSAGRIVGSLYQDRLTAVAGEIGKTAYTFPVNYSLDHKQSGVNNYSGNLFLDKRMTPLLSAISLLEVLNNSMQKSAEQSYQFEFNIEIKDQPHIKYKKWGHSFEDAFSHIIQYYQFLRTLTDNPFQAAKIVSIDVRISLNDKLEGEFLHELQRTGGPLKAGKETSYNIQTINAQGEVSHNTIHIPLNDLWKGETLEILISDAENLKEYDQGYHRNDWNSLDDIVGYIKKEKPNNTIYVRVMRKSEGLRIRGQELLGIPQSIYEVLTSPNIAQKGQFSDYESLWETSIELPVSFTGYHNFKIHVH